MNLNLLSVVAWRPDAVFKGQTGTPYATNRDQLILSQLIVNSSLEGFNKKSTYRTAVGYVALYSDRNTLREFDAILEELDPKFWNVTIRLEFSEVVFGSEYPKTLKDLREMLHTS